MPLPTSGPIVLHASQSSSTLGGQPKRAMIFKLSDEALDALVSQRAERPSESAMHVEFGANPGIHIGSAFFPSKVLKEESAHELLIRQDRPDAPLRHHAIVEGKLTVVRELLPEVGNRVRQRGEQLTGLSKAKPIQIIEKPPPTGTKGSSKPSKKSGTSSSLMKQVTRTEAKLKAGVVSRPTSPLPADLNDPVRKELIHHLAKHPASKSDVLETLGQSEPTRRRLSELLPQVATEDAPTKRSNTTPPPRLWRLKVESWLEVRPYEYPGLTDAQRRAVAITTRAMLNTLKIPETDPRWDHVKLKSSSGPSGHANGASNGSSKLPSKGRQQATTKKGGTPPELDLPKSTPPPKRILPGSRQTTERTSASPLPSPSFPPSSSKMSSSQLKPSDAKLKVGDGSPMLNRKPSPGSRAESSQDSIRRRDESAPTSVNRSTEDPSPKGSLVKRKRPLDEEPLSSQMNGQASKASRRYEDTDATEHRSRESLHVSKTHKRTDSTASNLSNSLGPKEEPNASKKLKPPDRRDTPSSKLQKRRKSPVYTSTEDEADDVPAPRKTPSGPTQSPKVVRSRPRANGYLGSHAKFPFGGPLPHDRPSLRKRYDSLYPTYLNLYQKSVAQRAAIQSALDKDSEEGEVDEDGFQNEEMLDADDLERLKQDLGRVEQELERIKRALA